MLHREVFFRGQHQSVPSYECKIHDPDTEPGSNTQHSGTVSQITKLIKNCHERDNNRNPGSCIAKRAPVWPFDMRMMFAQQDKLSVFKQMEQIYV